MSLDFYLEFPKICEKCGHESAIDAEEIFCSNITHNLGNMAREAGIYEALWHPVENGFRKARQITPILNTGLTRLKSNPKHFEQFNSSNGWGLYEHFVPFVEEILKAYRENPDANVRTSC